MVCVPSMIDVQDIDQAAFVVDAVADPVLTAARAPQTLERSPQGRSDASGVCPQRPVYERPRREGGIGGQGFS
jgi:hypothetical protein